jgi:hypothetical protein
MLTGIRMFNDINNISDGHYYCNHLKNVLDRGAYTSALKIRTYFPNDDSSNNDTDAMHVRLGKFINKLDGFPHLWIHYGHGNYGNATVDKIGKEHVWLEPSLLKEHLVFNRFRNIGHVRLVDVRLHHRTLIQLHVLSWQNLTVEPLLISVLRNTPILLWNRSF